ncbi:GNAT family N-acetyltransferase [Kutzneria sp. CA-103260]|uniref:GNAT family N-acetyltransferase n=1 Tax=Kutzneria sp. CA-103260 TaxID=2802641 RepID=UPI001BA61CAE|nr:GNAT family N-acetyltransferase [Kutzneria sp. CA-103260]QUQ67738.1 GNAT family N-acetyltransferase [Kutzneria sp. CA-103260]
MSDYVLRFPVENRITVAHNDVVVGHAEVLWWRERDGTWVYLHVGNVDPEHRGRGVGSRLLAWAESRIRELVAHHGTAGTAVFGANAAASEPESTALLLDAGYRRVFSQLEMERDLRELPDSTLPPGTRLGPVDPKDYRDAWRMVVDSYAGVDFTQEWTFESFLDCADPTCWRAIWEGEELAGVALCFPRGTFGEVEELSVRAESRRRGLGRAVLLDGLRCLREHGAATVRLHTGSANPHGSYDLYRSVGFRQYDESVRYRKPV